MLNVGIDGDESSASDQENSAPNIDDVTVKVEGDEYVVEVLNWSTFIYLIGTQ